MADRTCSVEECTTPVKALTLCSKHYQRFRQHGDVNGGGTKDGEPLAFFGAAMLIETDECIIWPYYVDPLGYGKIRINGVVRPVHAVACERKHGPAPEGKTDASHGPCHTPSCFNGRHVSWKTHKENVRDRERDGTVPRGELCGSSKLTDVQITEIRMLLVETTLTQQQIADRYGVNQSTVSLVLSGKTWTHI